MLRHHIFRQLTGTNCTFPPDPSDTTAKCRTSQLTQDKLVEMIRAIATHGDLTDIPFIEKTLGTKLKEYHPGNKTVQTYHAHVLGTGVSLYMDVTPHAKEGGIKPHPKWGIRGLMRFAGVDLVAANFHDCGYLMKDAFEKKYGGRFFEHLTGSASASQAANQELGEIGKDGTYMGVGYGWRSRDGVVDEIDIGQHPETPRK